MTKLYANKVIKVAKGEVGYQEKETNNNLNSKHANVGDGNYTKYGKAMGCNGQPYCDAFVDWCFVEAYGRENAKKLLNGFSNYTPDSANRFKKNDQYIKRGKGTPKKGDVIFFYSSSLKRIAHTGLVHKVENGKVYTIEGNTSSNMTEFERDGGCVAYKVYDLTNTRIDGYGRPKYDKKPSNKIKVKADCKLYKKPNVIKGSHFSVASGSKVQFVKDNKKGWSKVKCKNVKDGKTYTGWIKNTCLDKNGLSKFKWGVTTVTTTVRKKNSIKSKAIVTLTKNSRVMIVSQGKYWANIIYTKNEEKTNGFIPKKTIKMV